MRLVFRLMPFAVAALLGGCGSGMLSLNAPDGHHPFPTVNATPGVSAHPVHGIDVSKYQGDIDWGQVKASGVAFAWIKATEGADHIDHKFQQNWYAAKAAGVPRGAYHFAYWCSPVQDQIRNFKNTVPIDHDALPPVLDVEWNHDSRSCKGKVAKDDALRYMRTFLVAMEHHYGKRPVIYADIPFHRDILADGDLHEYPFWIRSVKDLPQQRYTNRKWSFWQYTASGSVPGIAGKVDRNVFSGSHAHWQQAMASGFRTLSAPPSFNRPAAKPQQPVPEPVPQIEDDVGEGGTLVAATQPIQGAPRPLNATLQRGAAVQTDQIGPVTPLAVNEGTLPPAPARPAPRPAVAPPALPPGTQPLVLPQARPATGAPLPLARAAYNPALPMPPASAAELRNPAQPLPAARPKKKECPYGVPVCQ